MTPKVVHIHYLKNQLGQNWQSIDHHLYYYKDIKITALILITLQTLSKMVYIHTKSRKFRTKIVTTIKIRVCQNTKWFERFGDGSFCALISFYTIFNFLFELERHNYVSVLLIVTNLLIKVEFKYPFGSFTLPLFIFENLDALT